MRAGCLWIGRQQSRPIRVMDLTLPLSFHTDAEQHVYFPYTTGTLALRYLDKAKVDYVVLRHGQNYTKYHCCPANKRIDLIGYLLAQYRIWGRLRQGLDLRHFLEEGDRKDLEQCVEGGVEIEPFFDDGDEDVD